jgi:hypothetical protein
MKQLTEESQANPFATWILLIAAILEVAAMMHHPSVRTPDPLEAAREMVALSFPAAMVHGLLITLMLLVSYGCAVFVSRRGLSRPLIGIGSIFYAAGVVVMIGAALVSGFVLSDLARLLPHATAADSPDLESLFILCRVLNRTCANFGVMAMSVGIACWSLDLLGAFGMRRVVGVWGCLVGIVPLLALPLGWIHLDVHGMAQVVALHASWYVALAYMLGSPRWAAKMEGAQRLR